MRLADQLRPILEKVLPVSPEEAIFGSDLLELVRPSLVGQYSDNSIRQAFSSLAADATSPIARIEQGFGYYRRPATQAPRSLAAQATGGAPAPPPDFTVSDVASRQRDFQPEERFRAFFIRNSQFESHFPVHIEHTAASHQPAGVNKWKFPDVVELDWDAGETHDEGFVLDNAVLEVKRSLGEQPFRLTSIEG